MSRFQARQTKVAMRSSTTASALMFIPLGVSSVRAERKRKHFEEIWNGRDKFVDIFSFPDAVKRKLIRVCEEHRSGGRPRQEEAKKWRHQDDALEEFLAAERGVLNMATGTGKTRTALKIVSALFEAQKIDTVIVAMDGTDLLNQWYGELLLARRDLPVSVNVFRDYDMYKEVQDFSSGTAWCDVVGIKARRYDTRPFGLCNARTVGGASYPHVTNS